MELTKCEVAVVEQAEAASEVQTINDLQLALVGGGMGDTVL